MNFRIQFINWEKHEREGELGDWNVRVSNEVNRGMRDDMVKK